MSSSIAAGLLWLFVIFLGISFGAGMYEERIVVSRWLSSSEGSGRHWNADEARRDDTGRRFWAFVTTVPLTLLTLAQHTAGDSLPRCSRLETESYFIPTMIRLMNAEDSSESVRNDPVDHLNYVRLAMVLAAWLASLKAFSLLYQNRV
jgi:hypothetical protein